MTDHMKLSADTVAVVDPESRTITGRIVRFGVPSSTQRVTIRSGSLTPRDPIGRVKLLLDHDKSKPIGYMTALELDDDGATATFHVPDTPAGNTALAEAKAGLRDGLSVGIAVREVERQPGGLLVHDAELYEVSLLPVPDFADAYVTNVTASATEKEPTMTETNITAEPVGITEEEAAEAVTATLSTTAPERQFAPPIDVAPRALNLSTAVNRMADAINSGNPDEIRLALADIVPADDKGKGFIGRDDWLGELWTASDNRRPWFDLFGGAQQLTTLKGVGYRWKDRPAPGKYKGNKTEVPTNKASTEAVEFTAERWAGGWDIDRIFIDLGDPGFLQAFWTAALAEYATASNADIAEKVIAAATASKATATNALSAIKTLASEMRAIGATPTGFMLSPDLFDQYADLKQSEVPFWLANTVGGVDLNAGTATPTPGIMLTVSPELPTGTVLAADRRAATVREKTPIRINGVDIARGGVDLGFYSYGRLDVNDPRAIRKLTVSSPAA